MIFFGDQPSGGRVGKRGFPILPKGDSKITSKLIPIYKPTGFDPGPFKRFSHIHFQVLYPLGHRAIWICHSQVRGDVFSPFPISKKRCQFLGLNPGPSIPKSCSLPQRHRGNWDCWDCNFVTSSLTLYLAILNRQSPNLICILL